MKRIITLAFVVFSVLGASAQYGQSILNLRLSDNAPFKMYIDGQPAGQVGNTIKLTNLQGGQHFLQVYRIGSYSWGHHHGMNNAFSGNIVLSANSESWLTVYPEMQKVKFDDVQALCDPAEFNPGLVDHHHPKLPVQVAGCIDPSLNNFPAAPVGPCVMNPRDFNQLKQTINNAGFENTRLTIFKQALAYNYFTTAQVRELMNQFWFEGTKLEVAKLAYPKTVDQNNYYLVNNEFTFSGSVDELGQYIAMK